jgi:hypothetical protein
MLKSIYPAHQSIIRCRDISRSHLYTLTTVDSHIPTRIWRIPGKELISTKPDRWNQNIQCASWEASSKRTTLVVNLLQHYHLFITARNIHHMLFLETQSTMVECRAWESRRRLTSCVIEVVPNTLPELSRDGGKGRSLSRVCFFDETVSAVFNDGQGLNVPFVSKV